MLKNNYYLFIFFLLLSFSGIAQNGAIKGKITDAITGEELFGATIFLVGTSYGADSDFDGSFAIDNIPSGTYKINVVLDGYEAKLIPDYEIKPGDQKTLNVRMGEAEGAIVIDVKGATNTEEAQLKAQQDSDKIQDAISSSTFSKTGDGSAGSALQRVVGLSVEGGKYAYVRGLGDRYSKTYLNGAEIPSLDPNRNSVQVDLFPSNLIDNMVVYKTFSPELPGNFSGGVVNIVTKDFPDKFNFNLGGSWALNTNATFNDRFLTYAGGKFDWLGFDDGTRAIPEYVENNGIPSRGKALTDTEARGQLDRASKSFNKILEPETKSPFLNQSYSFSIGNNKKLLGKDLGFIIGANYQKTYQYYEDGKIGRFTRTGANVTELNPRFLLSDRRGEEEALWGALANFSYKLSRNHKIGINFMRNQSGKSVARFLEGQWSEIMISDDYIYQSRVLQYIERSITTSQIRGEHFLGKGKDHKLDWLSSFVFSKQDEPDLRFFTNDYQVSNGDTLYQIQPAAYQNPARFFRFMEEVNIDNKVNYELPYKQWAGIDSKLKFGAAYLYKHRDFIEKRYTYFTGTDADPYMGNLVQFLADTNVGAVNSGLGVVIEDASQSANTYAGNEKVLAGYMSTELPITRKFNFSGGLRVEKTDILVTSANPNKNDGVLDNLDLLPATNFKYELVKDTMNLRFSYSRTLARPTFRELAPYASFDFASDFLLIGNDSLKRSLIDNFDLRWEWYPRSGEIVAVSPFYKIFRNPIEKVLSPMAVNYEITYRNVPLATVIGVEFEMRKSLEFIGKIGKNLDAGVNLSLLKSRVDINEDELKRIRATEPEADGERPMFGQSPYMLNTYVNYENDSLGLKASVSFNVFGERIAAVSQGGLPNVYEQPRGLLNLTVSKELNERWTITASAKNLLNPEYKLSHEFRNEEYIYSSYKLGRTFAVGIKYKVD